MAKEEEYFNPLDPLGPEFGKINQPIADTKGYTAFEGSRVMLPQPNMPVGNQIAYSNLPKLENLNAPNNQIYDNVVRTNINNPSIPQKAFDINEYNDSLKGYLDNMFQSNQDLNDYARIYSYDAGSTNLNTFYKRYSAYGQEKFDEVGFSPLRDNDANFNARTTRWDDFSRMMSNSFVPLFTQGFTSGFKSFGKILRGDFTSSDREDAEVYETAAAIGQSTKGGIGGFMNNAAMNFSYTAGIITEAIAEETLGAILAAPTGGSSLFTTTVNNARKLPSLLKGVKTGYQGVRQTLNLTKEISGARKVYNAIKESQFLKGTLNQLNPLNNTMGALKQIRQADNFTNLGKIYKTAGGLYRDARNINMALSEARLEGGMVQNKIYDELYREAYKANGNKVPSDKELAEISKQAEQGGYETLLENVGIIYATNAITFNNITGPRGGLRNFIKSTTDDIYEIASREGSKNFGKIGKVIYNRTSKAFELEANNLKTWAKGWLKNPIHKSVGKTVGYFKANFSEGIQENLQETIAQANEKYFMDSYNSPTLKSMLYSRAAIKGINKGRLDYFSDAWAQQNPFTAQGFETFASGFAMGTMAGPLNSAVPFLSRTYNRMFNKEEYTRWKEAQTTVAQNLVNELNNTNLETFLNGYTQNLGVQERVAATKQKGTKKEALDAETEAYISQVQLLKRTGTFGIFSEKLKDLHNLTDDEFAETVGIEKDQVNKYRARVDSSIERLNKIKNLYERVERKNPNPINVSDLKEDDPEYQDKLILYHAWETVNRNIVFFNETYDDILHRRSEINKKYNNNKKLKNISNRKRNLLFNPIRPFNETKEAIDGVGVPTGDMLEEINLLEKELALEKETTKNPAKIQMLQEQINLTKDYAEQYRALDIFQRREEYVGLIKEKLKAETGTEYTDEQVLKFMEDEFGAVNDTQKRDELLKNLRNSYTNYLKTHAKQNGQEIFNEDIDETWELMKDYYDLDIEKTKISKYVDVLNDPMAFLEAVRRNNDWLKKVTAKKIEYYEKIIREEMDNIRANALLNALANKGLFISTEDMLNYFADGVPPTEIYDDINKKIYPIGSKEYSQIYQDYFKKYEELKEDLNPNKSEIIDEAYQQQINALEKEKQEKIDALPKEDVETQINNLEGKISLKSLSQEIQNDQYAELTVLQAKPTTKAAPISDDKADISEGEAVSVHTPRKLFKGRLKRIKENQEGKRRAQHSVSGDGYVVSLKQDDFNETDEQGRPMEAGAEVYLNENEVDEIKKIEQKAKMKLIDNVQKNEALQQVYRDVFKRALDTYEVVDDANFETSVEARRNNYKAKTTPTTSVTQRADIEKRKPLEKGLERINKILEGNEKIETEEQAIKVLNEIHRFRRNHKKSGLATKKELNQMDKFEQEAKEKYGLEIVSRLGEKYDERENVDVINFEEIENPQGDKKIIIQEIKPQINKNDFLIQRASVKVLQGLSEQQYNSELDALEGNTSELEKITVYKDKVGQLRLKNEEGDILDSEDTTQRYSSARIYTIDKVSDPVEIEKITNFYNDKIEEVKEAYVASKENMELEIPYEDVTPESNLDTPDLSEFKEELYNNYQKEYVNKLSPSEKNALLEDEDLNNKTFEEWYSRPENKKYFDEYNNANRPVLSKQETIMNIRGVEVNTNTKTLEQLIAYRDDVNNQITSNNEEINFLDPETEKEQIKKYEEKNKELSLNLKNLNNIISARQFANFPEEIKSAVRSIQKLFKAQSKVEKGVELTEDDEVTGLKKGQKAYRINGKFHRRTTQAIQDVIDETYEYQGQEEVDTIFKQTIAKKGLNPASIKEFVDRLRSLPDTGEAALPGTNDIFFNKLQQELNALPNMTAEQIELERQKNEILTKANKEKNLAKQQALFDQAEEIQNKIDGAYTAPVSDKKADIERRRQEELSNTGLYEYDRKFKEFQTYGSTVKEAFDNLFEEVKNNPTNKKLSDLLDYINDRLVPEDIQKNSDKNPLVQEYINENQQDIEKSAKSTKTRIGKINAKYDAELAALEGKPTKDIEAKKADIEKNKEELNFYTVDKLKTDSQYSGYVNSEGNIYEGRQSIFNNTVAYANKMAYALSKIGKELSNKNGKKTFLLEIEDQEFNVTVNFDGSLQFRNVEFNISLKPFNGTENANTVISDLQTHLNSVGREVLKKETGKATKSEFIFEKNFKEEFDTKYQEELDALEGDVSEEVTINDISTTQSNINDVQTLDGKYWVPKKVFEEAYKNDTGNRGGQTVDDIIFRGGYSVKELDKLFPKWKELTVELNKSATKEQPTSQVSTEGPRTGFRTFNVPISKKENIADVVAGPLVPASEIFWDKNIQTTGSWIESIQGKAGGQDYIEIAYDSLSEENKKVANELKESDTNFGGVKGVRIALGSNLTAEQAQRKSIEIANKFKQQDLLWYKPQTLEDKLSTLESSKKSYSKDASKAIDQEIQRIKDTWGKELQPGQYFDTATKTIWDSKELYDKSKMTDVELAALEGTAQPTTKDNFDTATKKNTTKNIIDTFFAENTYEDSRIAGNFFDLAKDYLESGKKPEFNEEIITREAYDSLIEYLDTIKKRVDSGELYIVGRDLIVYDSDIVHQDGKKDRIAGEIDLILVDKDGIYVVDIKSGETNKFLNFNNLSTTNKKFTKRNEYTLQTAAYATMLEKMIDRKVAGIAMLPIQRESNKKTNQVIEAGKPLSGQFFNELEYKVDEDGKIVINKKIDPKTKKPFNEKQFTITGNKYKFDFLVPLYRESVQEEMDKLFPKKLGELEPGGKRAIANRINNIRERLSEITDELSDINVKNLAIIKVLIDNAVKQNISIPKDIIEQYESKNKNLKQYTSKEKIKSVIDKYKKNLNSSEKNLKEQSDKLRKIKSNVSFDNVDKSIFNEQSNFIKEQLESDSNFKYYFDQHNSFYKNAVDRSPTDNQIVAIETMKESGLLTDTDISDADIKYLSMAEASELIHEGVKRIQYLKTSSVEKSKDFREYQKNIFDLMKATKINSNDVSLVQLFEDAEKISKTGRTKQAIDLLNIKLNNLNSEYNKEFTSDVRKTKILKEILDIEQFKEALIDTYEMPIDIVEQVQESEIVEEFIDEFDTDINVGDIVYSRKKNNNTPYKVKEKTKDSYVLSPPRGKAITVKIDTFADNYITKIEMDSGNITPPTVEVTDTEKEILNESQVTVNNFLQNQDSKTKAYEKGIKNTPEENRKNLLNKTKNCL